MEWAIDVTKSDERSSRRFNVYALELVVDAVAEAGRTDEMKRHRPMQTDAEEPIEAGKMIHVGVRYEGIAHAQEVARRQRRQIAEVEQNARRPKRKSMNSPGSENGSLTRLG